jgi:ribosome biogenesis protein MAK21
LHHYHPTVALHSRQLLLSQPLTAVPDLSLNTLSHFLDRFVYKNPKKGKNQKGASAMQPAATAADGTGVKLHKGEVKDDIGLMNDPALLRRKPEDVPVDQVCCFIITLVSFS